MTQSLDDEGQVPWAYTPVDKKRIVDALRLPDDEADLVIAQIVMAISMTNPTPRERSATQSDQAAENRQLRQLGKHIDQVLEDFSGLSKSDIVQLWGRGLVTQLQTLRKFLPRAKAKRGATELRRNFHMRELVEVLASIWWRYRGSKPSWTYVDLEESDTGPFRDFISDCTEPAGLRVPDSVLRDRYSAVAKEDALTRRCTTTSQTLL